MSGRLCRSCRWRRASAPIGSAAADPAGRFWRCDSICEGMTIMAEAMKLGFEAFSTQPKGVVVLFCEEGLKIGPASRRILAPAGDLLQRAAAADRFTGKSGSALDIVAPAGIAASRLVVLGV